MKIISKHKDYYDYLQGIYGVDELKVLDRRSDNSYTQPELSIDNYNRDNVYHYTFAICNELYDVYVRNSKFYHTYEEYVELCKLHGDKIPIYIGKQRYTYNEDGKDFWRAKHISEKVWNKLQGRKTKINSKFRIPILVDCKEVDKWYNHEKEYDWNNNVILDDFKFIKKLDAQTIYTKLDTFLGWLNDNPEKESNITNDEKIKGKGFDIKKSFRHRK